MPYDFQARIPVDHVVTLVGILRGTIERERGDVLILCGATFGEAGALLKNGLVSVAESSEFVEVTNVEEQAGLLAAKLEEEPTFDITPWLPLILKIIELLLARR